MEVKLTNGECWWLARRRLDWTQAHLASHLGVPVEAISAWEADRVAGRPITSDYMRYLETPLTPGEFITLARRRMGWTMERAARWATLSRQAYLQAEHDRTTTAERLALRWVRRGLPVPEVPARFRIASWELGNVARSA